jgi:chaperone required for assembly of F1-ATPase
VSWPRRRFWRAATVRPLDAGFGLFLDARELRTPAGVPLVVPTEALAEAIAAEWAALEGEIDPGRLPLTRAANSAIDRVARQREAVVEAVAAYGGTDLLCYRADEPEGLVARQAAGWDPWLVWSARALHAPLIAVTGVMHEPQPPASLAALRAAVAAEEPFALTALAELVALSGSLVLGLAVAAGALAAEEAWALSRIDETWQEERWGTDAEAAAAAAARRAEFLQARDLLALLGRALPGAPEPSAG